MATAPDAFAYDVPRMAGEADLRIVAYVPVHSERVLAVVRKVYDEYGFTWDDSPYFADLRDPITHYVARGGMFWTLLEGVNPIGCVGVTPHGRACELHRLYLDPACRGRGLGAEMLNVVIEWARTRGMRRVVLWSDVVLTHAHALYRANGFIQHGQRYTDDPDLSPEYGFFKNL